MKIVNFQEGENNFFFTVRFTKDFERELELLCKIISSFNASNFCLETETEADVIKELLGEKAINNITKYESVIGMTYDHKQKLLGTYAKASWPKKKAKQ